MVKAPGAGVRNWRQILALCVLWGAIGAGAALGVLAPSLPKGDMDSSGGSLSARIISLLASGN